MNNITKMMGELIVCACGLATVVIIVQAIANLI
jgi:hypothetical protein